MIGRVEVTRRGVARAGLALAVAAVAACVVYFGGRALGLGGDAPALGQGDPPVLAINVPETCETPRERAGYGTVWGEDDEGNWVRTGTSGPFYHLGTINTVELEWSISGGTEPYEISVQGQTLLTGPTGSTLVYCAGSLPYDELDFTQPRDEYERTELDGRPIVSPGPMAFEATVKDADGLSATATTRTYVIVDCDRICGYEVLPSGYTYRVFGQLMTIPQGLDIYFAEYGINTPQCVPGAKWCASHYELILVGDAGGVLRMSTKGNYLGYYWKGIHYYPDGTDSSAASQVGGQAVEEHPLANELGQFGRSIGQPPSLAGN